MPSGVHGSIDPWEWMVQSGVSAHEANTLLNGPSPFDAGPTWCFQRFGQTVSYLPGARRLLIGGEHEDWYDPDFYIYNDLVAIDATGAIEIYGYPCEDFPPTDLSPLWEGFVYSIAPFVVRYG